MNYNIAVLIDSIYDDYENKLWYELVEIAKTKAVNLITLVGGAIHSPYEQNSKRNVTYDLLTRENFHGIISFSSTIGGFATPEELKNFLKRFSPLPIVNIGVAPSDYPAILINNEEGMHQLLDHILRQHKYRRVAFIRGPSGNTEAEIRYRVYRDKLKEYNIPIDEDLIVRGDFCRISGATAVAVLLDERRADFDAVVAANDYMAIDAMKELQNRGIRVPEDIAVVGFDDLQESSCLMHPLTTVKQPIPEIARHALGILLDLLEGRQGETRIVLPAKLVVRRSCGCFIQLAEENPCPEPEPLAEILSRAMSGHLGEALDTETKRNWLERLLKNFELSLKQQNQKFFLVTLEDILIQSTHRDINILTWYPVISALFTNAGSEHKSDQLFHLLWKGSLIVIGNLAKQAQAHIHIFKSVQNYQLHLLSEAFRNIFDAEKQEIFMNKYLPELGIPSFYLGLFTTTGEWERVNLLLAYRKGEYLKTESKEISIHQLLREILTPGTENQTLIVYPIYSDREELGLVFIEDGPQDGVIYENIGKQLNISIYEAKLFRQVQQHALRLEEEVEARTRELILLNKRLELKSKLDGLTNLYNRSAIYEFLENKLTSQKISQWIIDRTTYQLNRRSSDHPPLSEVTPPSPGKKEEAAEPESLSFTIIMLDIDHFKKINDTYGHLFGDKVLRVMSNLLQAPDIFRKQDIVGRYGGEEFIVILPDTKVSNTYKVASRLKKRLDQTYIPVDKQTNITISVSMGISTSRQSDQNNEQVIYRADKALYFAKEHGRNKIIIYSDIFSE